MANSHHAMPVQPFLNPLDYINVSISISNAHYS